MLGKKANIKPTFNFLYTLILALAILFVVVLIVIVGGGNIHAAAGFG